jgi:hypothetical protein
MIPKKYPKLNAIPHHKKIKNIVGQIVIKLAVVIIDP